MRRIPWAIAVMIVTTLGMPLGARPVVAQEIPCQICREQFVALDNPCRIFDTRQDGNPLTTNQVPAPGVSTGTGYFLVRRACVPKEAKAIAYNWTVVGTFNQNPFRGHITLYPSHSPLPPTSSINFEPRQTIANGGIIKLNPQTHWLNKDLAATLVLQDDGSTSSLGAEVHVLLDVTGYLR